MTMSEPHIDKLLLVFKPLLTNKLIPMKTLAFLILTLFLTTATFAQDQAKYAELVKEASSLYNNKEYLQSGEKYAEAFVALGGKGMVNDRYNAACSWALAQKPDSAFVQLFKIAQNGNYTNYSHLTTDTDLSSLHGDQRWTEVTAIVKANKEKAEAHLDKPLVAMLDTIYQDDQKYRQEIKAIEEKYGWESPEMQANWKIMHEKDSINLIKVKKILDERGWLGADVVGGQGNATLFLVIQHADMETQEVYLPMMRDAVKNGNARASSLALLEDRVALRRGGKQIYGSQVGRDPDTGAYFVSPLIDPDNVNQRRAEVGLGTIQDYISNWGITWDVDAYKKKMAEVEAKGKE